jgi:selenocysteine lyase/cysteine desulfurase
VLAGLFEGADERWGVIVGDAPARRVYLDHAATSWPKPPEVAEAMADAVETLAGNPGRGAHRGSLDAARAVERVRGDVAAFLGAGDSRNLIFQPGCTQALNLVLFGLLRVGDRVVAGPVEHNAVARPLNVLAARGVHVVLAEADETGVVDPVAVAAIVREAPTRAVVCQQAGNLTGAIQPVAELAEIAHAAGALLVVDGAQAGGHLDVDIAALGADAWACAGHKGLLGPQGIGILHLSEACDPEAFVFGGSGEGASEDPVGPRTRPARYEAGTPNTPGIAGLGAGVAWLREHGAEQRALEERLVRLLHEGLLALPGFQVLGPGLDEPRVPVLAVVHERVDAGRLASALDREYGIAVRAGLHCAPWAHRVAGTMTTGALRLSLGIGNTDDDVGLVLEALASLAADLG